MKPTTLSLDWLPVWLKEGVGANATYDILKWIVIGVLGLVIAGLIWLIRRFGLLAPLRDLRFTLEVPAVLIILLLLQSLFVISLRRLLLDERKLFKREDNVGNTLLRLLPDMAKSQNLDRAIAAVAEALHNNLVALVDGGLCRMHIYMADPTTHTLTTLVACPLVSDPTKSRTLSIDPHAPNDAKGVAGCAFLSNSVQVCNFTKDQFGNWQPSNNCFHHFPDRGDHPDFLSLIAAPIHLSATTTNEVLRPVGVLCLGSHGANAFDDPLVQKFIQDLADHKISAAICQYNHLVADRNARTIRVPAEAALDMSPAQIRRIVLDWSPAQRRILWLELSASMARHGREGAS